MNPFHQQGWAALLGAKARFLSWAATHVIAVKRVEHVAVFEEWSKDAEIYVFFPNDADLEQHKRTGKLQEIEGLYRQFLSDANYPSDRFPVRFYFDSHENVVKNYQGSYFYRLR